MLPHFFDDMVSGDLLRPAGLDMVVESLNLNGKSVYVKSGPVFSIVESRGVPIDPGHGPFC